MEKKKGKSTPVIGNVPNTEGQEIIDAKKLKSMVFSLKIKLMIT